jgi:hypothetical protein
MKHEPAWPKPDELLDKERYKKWKNGTHFVLKGGPHEGLVLRLWPHPYVHNDVSGWDEIQFTDGTVYRRPEGVDPYMQRTAVNKKRTNIPHMEWVEGLGQLGDPSRAS